MASENDLSGAIQSAPDVGSPPRSEMISEGKGESAIRERKAAARRQRLELKLVQLGNLERLAEIEVLADTSVRQVALDLRERLAKRITQADAAIERICRGS